ncbi:MAG: citrate/2-methylcitrate synthase [bacterium]|nr:citrate/2-methylcitrate synthase [bacterium]
MGQPPTPNKFKAGLEGIVAAQSEICNIDGEKGILVYAGYDIHDLADHATFEEVIFLLWNLRLPNQKELKALKKDLEDNCEAPKEILEFIKKIAKKSKAMDVLRTAVSYLSYYDSEMEDASREANERKALRIVAQFPSLVAAYHRFRQGKKYVPHKPGMSYAERFVYQLNGEKPLEEAAKAMDLVLVLHAEHSFNASTFAGRVAAGTLTDIYSAVTAAIAALKGPLHGGANEVVFKMLEEIGSVANVRRYVEDKLSRKEKIFGFGHRVYKTLDPRATHLMQMSERLGRAHNDLRWFEISREIHKVVKELKNIEANVDFYSASVYHLLGVPGDLFTSIFAISRSSGWTAHILEQYRNNRLIRPEAEYIGQQNLKYIPIEKR